MIKRQEMEGELDIKIRIKRQEVEGELDIMIRRHNEEDAQDYTYGDKDLETGYDR